MCAGVVVSGVTFWMASAVALAAVNLSLLTVLGYVWLSNYRTFRTNLLLGLLLFAAVLGIENIVAIAAYVGTDMIYGGGAVAMYATVGLRALQFGALVFFESLQVVANGVVLDVEFLGEPVRVARPLGEKANDAGPVLAAA